MRQSHRLAFNAVVTYGATLVQGVVGFLLVPYIVTRIGKEHYGIVLLAMSALSMIEIFGMALTQAVTKHVASEDARGTTKQINAILSSSMLWFFAVGTIGAVGAVVAGLQFSRLFPDVSPELAHVGRLSMFIMAGTIIACLMGDAWKGVLAGYQRYDVISATTSCRSLLRAITVVAYFTIVGPSILPVVVIFAVFHVLERVGFAVACRWVAQGVRASPALVTRYGLSAIAGFATFLLVATTANLLVSDVLKVVIGREISLSALADYGIALVLITFANGIVRSFLYVVMPVASKYQKLGDDTKLRKLLLHGTKYSVVAALACLGVTAPFLPSLYRLWMGVDFVHLVGITMVMFAGQAVVSSSTCSTQILNGMGRVRFTCAVSIGWATAAFVAACAHLVLWREASLLSTVAIMAVGRSIGGMVTIAYGMKVIGVAWNQLLVQSYLKPLLICGVATAIGFACVRFARIETWGSLIGVVVALEVLFVALSACWCLDKEEKGLTIQLIRRFAAVRPTP